MTTLSEMVNEVSINLAGYTIQQDRSTFVRTTAVGSADTVLNLGSTDSVGKGIVEIDDELIWVDSYDRLNNTASIAPYGRGYLGTTAAAHAANTKVTISPTFPRFTIKRAINDTIRAVGQTLSVVKATTFVYNSAVTTYEFSGLDIQNILSLSYESIGPSKEWIPVRRWRFDSYADDVTWGGVEGSSQTVSVYDIFTSGRTVKVLYLTNPAPLSANENVFTTVTGFKETTRDIIIYGAIYRLLTFLDPARAAMVAPQADETDSKRPFGSSGSTSRQIYNLYAQRLNEEVKNQQSNYPIRVHYAN